MKAYNPITYEKVSEVKILTQTIVQDFDKPDKLFLKSDS